MRNACRNRPPEPDSGDAGSVGTPEPGKVAAKGFAHEAEIQ